jgi:hypothetical protein
MAGPVSETGPADKRKRSRNRKHVGMTLLISDRATSVKSQVALPLPVPQLQPADWAGLTPVQLAFLGADVAAGELALPKESVTDIAGRLSVSPSYVYAALRCTPEERAAILAGRRPLVPENLSRAWSQADEATRARHIKRIACHIGSDQLLALAVDCEARQLSRPKTPTLPCERPRCDRCLIGSPTRQPPSQGEGGLLAKIRRRQHAYNSSLRQYPRSAPA